MAVGVDGDFTLHEGDRLHLDSRMTLEPDHVVHMSLFLQSYSSIIHSPLSYFS